MLDEPLVLLLVDVLELPLVELLVLVDPPLVDELRRWRWASSRRRRCRLVESSCRPST